MAGIIPKLTIQEVDGSPSAKYATLKMPNGTLTDNADGTVTYTAASSTPTPATTIATTFETAARFVVNTGGTGAATFNDVGLKLDPGATGTSFVNAQWTMGNGSSTPALFSGSPTFSATIHGQSMNVATNSASMFIGIGKPTVAGTGHTFTVAHIGFKLLKTGGAVSLYATQADGTETASSALTTIVNNDVLDLICKVNSTTSVDYYWRKNGGSLSSATNLTTHLPTSATDSLQFSSANDATATAFLVNVCAASYSR